MTVEEFLAIRNRSRSASQDIPLYYRIGHVWYRTIAYNIVVTHDGDWYDCFNVQLIDIRAVITDINDVVVDKVTNNSVIGWER